MENRTTLVLGATGGIGSEVAAGLATAGWEVRALHRNPEARRGDDRFVWIKGDALVAGDVAAAAEGASLIVHAVNPPGYRDWEKLVLPMLDNTISAARGGKRILLPGTVYNYGPDAFPDIVEDAPQIPVTRKGRIRVELERRLGLAAERGDAKVLIVRAGDFFGPRAANNWFSQGLVKPGSRPTSISYPGKRGVGHQWAYLPDVAETMVRLIDEGDLEPFATYHMEGHWDADGSRMTDAIRRALGRNVSVKRMPWWLIKLAAPFVPLMRELSEMKYLWDQPVRLRNAKLVAAIGAEPRTPLDEAVRTTLEAIGCLDAPTNTGRSAYTLARA
ncbi:NAD-dependent epimerase/dehydratase family protein [Sinorhizobium meliloti]|uniref:NAD-dependent epimerase/dehydratase family protein n=1 Tax=Rhizobium meliloti TaxID=382 RepID=UPI001F45B38E|nr:NAD-dependent epimerase/dehydratase family protein [Sinorhizobium meliloti]